MQKTAKQKKIDTLISFIKQHPDGCSTSQMREYLNEVFTFTKPITIKTVQNYMKDLKEKYVEGVEPILIKNGYYKIIDHRSPINENAIETEKKVYLKLAVEILEGLSDISKYHEELSNDLKLKQVNTAYYVKPEEYERLNTDEEEIKLLEEAILNDTIIIFSYKNKEYHVEPYRLVNFDGIWYLYGKDKEERSSNPYKTWMLEFIDDVEVDYGNKHDTADETINEHLDQADSAHFVLGQNIKMKFRVSSCVTEIFRRRNHFPDQKCIMQKDGSLLVHSTVSSFEDIDREVKSWLPHIEILEPQEYREKFLLELEAYRDQFKIEIENL